MKYVLGIKKNQCCKYRTIKLLGSARIEVGVWGGTQLKTALHQQELLADIEHTI